MASLEDTILKGEIERGMTPSRKEGRAVQKRNDRGVKPSDTSIVDKFVSDTGEGFKADFLDN